MPNVLVVLAEGFEEMEAIAPIDLLRRAEAEVTIASIGALELIGRSRIRLTAEQTLANVEDKTFDLIVIPGGPAFKFLRQNLRLRALLQRHAEEGKMLAAICAAPTTLFDAGLLEGRAYTAHFTVCDELTQIDKAQAVVEDGPIITSQGAGTATEFGLTLVKRLFGKEKADAIAASICV
tara:strand:- start:27744 stop:28280 length:537 start_codon:yes stop_codon:yes gene_type:complete